MWESNDLELKYKSSTYDPSERRGTKRLKTSKHSGNNNVNKTKHRSFADAVKGDTTHKSTKEQIYQPKTQNDIQNNDEIMNNFANFG